MNSLFPYYGLVIRLFVAAAAEFNYFEAQELGPCPHVLPVSDVQLKQMEGKWHLGVVVLDANKEDLEENSVCINGEIIVFNSTRMKHTWDVYTPHHLESPIANFELLIDEVRPGLWTVQTPLGSRMTAKLFGYEMDMAMAVFCGWQKGIPVHLFTAAVTRDGKLTSIMKLKMSSLMLDNGYHPSRSKLIVWDKC